MKTTAKLLLIYLCSQVSGGIVIYFMGQTASALIAGMLLGTGLMLLYLFMAGYVDRSRQTWLGVSPMYMALSVLVTLPTIVVTNGILSFLPDLPDTMKVVFDEILSAGPAGFLLIGVVGPIFEEILFRGAITKVLLKQFNPTAAILLSAALFGLVHFNPVQMVGAGLVGVLLAWVYYKTKSLLPCILIHVTNNSLSVFMIMAYPEVENVEEVIGTGVYYLVLALAVVLLAAGCVGLSALAKASNEKESV